MFGMRGKTVEKIEAETHAATFAERQALVEERERERTAHAAACEPLAREARAAAANVVAAEAAWKRAQAVSQEAHARWRARDIQGATAIARIDAQLERGADARIDALRAALEREWEEQRNSGAAGTGRHLAGLREAMRECAALKFEATPDIDAALATIRGRIPSKWATAA